MQVFSEVVEGRGIPSKPAAAAAAPSNSQGVHGIPSGPAAAAAAPSVSQDGRQAYPFGLFDRPPLLAILNFL